MAESVPMTEEGAAKIRKDIATQERRRPAIKAAIATAREKGDIKENADYHASREELAMLNAKVAQLQGLLANATIIDPSKAPKGKIVLGNTVTVKRLTDGREITRALVGKGQEDTAAGKILTTSPIGKALIGASAGDVVTAELPAGPTRFEILKIE